jgi:polyphosphate kinase
VHVGTGNYNQTTARLYTDLGLFTADPDIGADVAEMFNFITGYGRPTDYRKALVSPTTMRKRIREEIEATSEAKRRGERARIVMKMNALVDARKIRALYEASQAGVQVDLNIRGACCLRPGIPGVSENIFVNSVVGRFLEHSRVFMFQRGDETRVFIGSADLMPRNLDHRVELVVPIEDETLRGQVVDIVERSLADNTNAWTLDSDGRWHRREPGDDEPRNVQDELREWHAARAAEHPVSASE